MITTVISAIISSITGLLGAALGGVINWSFL